jgi:hypothetical protein
MPPIVEQRTSGISYKASAAPFKSLKRCLCKKFKKLNKLTEFVVWYFLLKQKQKFLNADSTYHVMALFRIFQDSLTLNNNYYKRSECLKERGRELYLLCAQLFD